MAGNVCTLTSREPMSEQPAMDDSVSEKAKEDPPLPPPRWLVPEEHGWRKLIQNFTPSWFSITMGTGIVSILLVNLPFSSSALTTLGTILFVLNIVLFAVIFGVSALRYLLYPKTWFLMIRHPVQSLFLGTLPMGFSTLITMTCLVVVPSWGGAWPAIAWAMWWIDVVVSVAVCMGLPFMIMSVHSTSLHTMTAVWLLPIVAPIVTAATGSTVASVLPNPTHALWTIVTSYVLWGMAVPLAMIVFVIYFHRLAMHKLPPREAIVSVFLPLGPLGQGGFSIMQLGKMAMETFDKTNTLHPLAGPVLYIAGFAIGLILWGFGLVWLFFALASITRSKFPFNMGWWGFTFPIGVFAMSTLTIAKEMPSLFFRVVGTAIAIAVMLLWLVVALSTAKNAISGKLFHAPCLYSQDNVCPSRARGERCV